MKISDNILRKAKQMEESWFTLKDQYGDNWLVMTKLERKLLIDAYIKEHCVDDDQNTSACTK